jgi:hypothetical protein
VFGNTAIRPDANPRPDNALFICSVHRRRRAARPSRPLTVGSAWPVMPVGQADADDADDAIHHGGHSGVSWCTMQPEPVTILKPMCRINMTPEGDPQV